MSTLARLAVRGTLAVAAANTLGRLVSFAGALYLMSAIDPDQFGLVAYAAALLALCDSLTNWGFAQAAIHRRERVDETFAAYRVVRPVLLAAALALLAALALPFRGLLLTRTRLEILVALAGVVLVDAACDAPATRLARAMRFGRLAAVEAVSVVLSTAVAIVLASLGFGPWALVGNRAAHALARTVGLALVRVDPLRLRFDLADALWLMRFGLPLWLGSLATTWVLNYDDLVVGSMRGKHTLGLYDRAYKLALAPLSLVTGVLTRVSFPLYARLQADRQRLSEAFRLASGTTFRLAAPMALGMALVIPDFLAVMHWRRWEPMAPMFRWLLLYAMARPLMDDAGGLLTAVGHPRITGHTLLAEAAALVVLCPLMTVLWGAQGAAASVGLVVLGGLAVWYTVYLPRFVDLSLRRLLLWPAAGLAAGAAAGMCVGAFAGLGIGLAGGLARLAAAAAAYAAVLLLLDGRQALADLRALRRHAFGIESEGGGSP